MFDNTLKILVADDSDYVRETVKYRLELEEGVSVITARDGFETLSVVREQRPDVILLDVMMPGENGYRVARAIREGAHLGDYGACVNIILVTARDLSCDPEREELFLKFSGADGVIYKPFDLEELVDKVVQGWIHWQPRAAVRDPRQSGALAAW